MVPITLTLVVIATMILPAGAERALEQCSADPPGAPVTKAASVEAHWSFRPLGFVCTYADGDSPVTTKEMGLWP